MVFTEDSTGPAATVMKAARRQRALTAGPGGSKLILHGPCYATITILSNRGFCLYFTNKETEAQRGKVRPQHFPDIQRQVNYTADKAETTEPRTKAPPCKALGAVLEVSRT